MEPTGTTLYNTFFRNVDPATVKGVLSRVLEGEKVPLQGTPQPPIIMCDNADVPAVQRSAVHAACANKAKPNALWPHDTNLVFLCEKFLKNKMALPTAELCVGRIGPDGGRSNGGLLGETQWSILLHELVHLYMIGPSLQPEAMNIYEVEQLRSPLAERNPANYAFFLASTRFPGFSGGDEDCINSLTF